MILLLPMACLSTNFAIKLTNGTTYQKSMFFILINSYLFFSINFFIIKYNYVDSNYKPNGSVGEFLQDILYTFIDLKGEIIIYTWILFLFLIPYFFSYIFVGLFGYARKIKPSKSIKYFILFCSKSMMSFSGAAIGLIASYLVMGLKVPVSIGKLFEVICSLIIYTNAMIVIFYLFVNIDLLNRFNSPCLNKIDKFFRRKITSQQIPPSEQPRTQE
ncbi:hypothetical protein [Gluconobacter sp. DsW_058]|uniref:hypothetical protein n=1 Tax=Gluconobacter sp. DsW_058 TaxID=1511210 RepID=UPI00117B55EB|nr:hypothetical protein [Gluconobacter sp. DsW_058]